MALLRNGASFPVNMGDTITTSGFSVSVARNPTVNGTAALSELLRACVLCQRVPLRLRLPIPYGLA